MRPFLDEPPHAPRNRGDCGAIALDWTPAPKLRLTPPGIAATAAMRRSKPDAHCPPPHAPRNRGDCGIRRSMTSTCRTTPPHAPRNRGDCGLNVHATASDAVFRLTPPGIAATAASRFKARFQTQHPASRPPESRRLRLRAWTWGLWGLFRLTPPGIAATAALTVEATGRLMDSASRPPESRRLRQPHLNRLRGRWRVADLRARERVSRRSPLRWGWTIPSSRV